MIAVFDSGLGGLGVLREMMGDFDEDDVVYAADRINSPYGTKTLGEVRDLTHGHVSTLVEHGASTVVLACNTASAAALTSLRQAHPDIEFVGMEPAIKPAAAATRTGAIGVLATSATFQGELFESLIDRYAEGLRILTRAAPEWVGLVERGSVEGPHVEAEVREHTDPLMSEGVDTLVLGCTHFGFLVPVIARVVGRRVSIIDPAPAVARQARLVHVSRHTGGSLRALVSGDAAQFEDLSKTVAGISFTDGVLPL